MARRLFLFVAAMFSCCASLYEGEATGKQRKIFAYVGETAVLPCQTNNWEEDLTVEWSKDDLKAIVYRDGRESYWDKHEAFEFRTNLFMNELRKGTISLRISNLQLSDNGTFICKTIRKVDGRNEEVKKEVELFVGAASEPKLSVVPSVDGGVTLQCEANGWFPEPEITFLDDQGKDIKAEEPKKYQNSTGCFTVTRRVTLQTATNSVTCKVHQRETDQTRATETYVQANCMCPCIAPISVAVVAFLIISGLVVFISVMYCNPGGCKLLPWKSSTKQSPVVSHHRQSSNVQNPKPSTSTDRSPIVDNLPQNKNSKPAVSKQSPPSNSHIQSSSSSSSPVLLADYADVSLTSPPASTSNDGQVARSMSMPVYKYRPNNPMLQPTRSPQRINISPLSNNRYSALGEEMLS